MNDHAVDRRKAAKSDSERIPTLPEVGKTPADKRHPARAEIWIGDVAASTEEERESYRAADVTVSNVQWIVIDPPDVSAFRQSDSITVDLFEGDPAIGAVGQLAHDGFTARLFVHEWNGFIHIAGSDARLIWADECSPNG